MSKKKQEDTVTSDDILGRDALDPEGELLGTVVKLHIDRARKELIGITVDQGFFRPDLYVGMDYIRQFGIDAIFLDRIPFEKYLGFKVFTKDGILLGTVEDVAGEVSIERITVKIKDPNHPMHSRHVEIQANHIKEIGSSIILKRFDKQVSGPVTER